MTAIRLTSKVGPDGVLNIAIPVGLDAANQDVRITVESIPTPQASPTREEWQQFVREIAGSITDPTFVRHQQGEYERQGDMFLSSRKRPRSQR